MNISFFSIALSSECNVIGQNSAHCYQHLNETTNKTILKDYDAYKSSFRISYSNVPINAQNILAAMFLLSDVMIIRN